MPLLSNLANALRTAPVAPSRVHAPRDALKPIVKWVGGKRGLLAELVSLMPPTYGRYVEPFCGGAALFFHVQPSQATLVDANENLIEMYRSVVADPVDLITELYWHQRSHNAAHYAKVRTRWNQGPDAARATDRAAAFIYLNKTCFNGLWRVNRKGEFNVPMGRYTNPKICDVDAIYAAAAALQDVILMSGDYTKGSQRVAAGDFFYFDPPYIPVSKTANFTAYTEGVFGETQHRELASVARTLACKGVHVMLSNSDTSLTRELYHDFQIAEVSRSGGMNSDPTKRQKVGELIITSYNTSQSI